MFKLLRYFSVASLLAFVATGSLIIYLYDQQAIKDIVTLEEEKTLSISRVLNKNFQQYVYALTTNPSRSLAGKFDDELHWLLEDSAVLELKLFNVAGERVFASEVDRMNEAHMHGNEHGAEADPDVMAALEGKISSEFIAKGSKHAGSITEQNVIVTHLPVSSTFNDDILGAFEVYSNADPLVAQIRQSERRLILTLAAILSGLYGLLLLIVARGQKILKWQHTQMQAQQETLEGEREQLRLEVRNRKQAEAKLSAANHDLERSKQDLTRSNQELEKFAYIASHDLQEPLRKVQTFGDRLASKYAQQLDDDGRLYIARMQDATARMRVLIQDLLVYSRVRGEAKDFVSVDLNDVVNGVVSDLEVRLEQSGGRIDVGDLPSLQADPLQMRQVFQNLIGNALKFKKSDVAPVVSVSSKCVGDAYEITVKDNGVGFEQQYADKVFEVFQRLHGRSDYEGTGIGLAIVRKVLERHGGSVRAKSSPGQGSEFLLTLPGSEKTETRVPLS
jgi:signal transduction histidine kinase